MIRSLPLRISLVCALFCCVIGSLLLAAPLDVFVQYNHGYFVAFQNVALDESWKTATEWSPSEEAVWPRWTFWFEIERNGVRLDDSSEALKLEVTTDTPIDLDLWHKPPITGTFPLYTWEEVRGNEDLTFMLDAHVTSNPGIRFERRAMPEVTPPGVCDLRIEANITVLAQPTINGEKVSTSGGFIQVFLHAWQSEWLRIHSCRVDWAHSSMMWGPLEVNLDRYSGDGFYTRLDFGGVPIGESFPLALELTVENLADVPLYFRPVVEINWRVPSANEEGSAGNGHGECPAFVVSGPNGETLEVVVSSQTGDSINLGFAPLEFHEGIWAYWPQVIALWHEN